MHGTTKTHAFVICMSFCVVTFAQVQLQCTSMLPTVKLNIQSCAKLSTVDFTLVPTPSEQLFKFNDISPNLTQHFSWPNGLDLTAILASQSNPSS